jgi:hypothetical protein
VTAPSLGSERLVGGCDSPEPQLRHIATVSPHVDEGRSKIMRAC